MSKDGTNQLDPKKVERPVGREQSAVDSYSDRQKRGLARRIDSQFEIKRNGSPSSKQIQKVSSAMPTVDINKIVTMAKTAAREYLTSKVDLNDTIAKQASDAGYNLDQIQRIVETANMITYQTLYKQANEDKNITFKLASAADVARRIAMYSDDIIIDGTRYAKMAGGMDKDYSMPPEVAKYRIAKSMEKKAQDFTSDLSSAKGSNLGDNMNDGPADGSKSGFAQQVTSKTNPKSYNRHQIVSGDVPSFGKTASTDELAWEEMKKHAHTKTLIEDVPRLAELVKSAMVQGSSIDIRKTANVDKFAIICKLAYELPEERDLPVVPDLLEKIASYLHKQKMLSDSDMVKVASYISDPSLLPSLPADKIANGDSQLVAMLVSVPKSIMAGVHDIIARREQSSEGD